MSDGNNKFFFNACRGRWNCNKILTIEDESGVSKTSHEDISAVAVDYYKNLLGCSKSVENIPTDLDLPKLQAAHSLLLTKDFTAADVLNVFKNMAKNKSPGPDGFSPEFYVLAWGIVGTDVVNAILWFFKHCHLPRCVNATAIALIPKQDCPSKMSHFRHISCCNVVYKCIAKLLAKRLKVVILVLISPNQSAFVPKRVIKDNVMLAQALCRNYHLKTGPAKCAMKLDISKAFDTLNWSFLFAAMEIMDFPPLFITWIKTCITTSMYSVKINGSLEGFFEGKSGIRQGDPISPYLFLIAMEVCSACIRQSTSVPSFQHHWGTKSLNITHLAFADDLLLFCKGETASITAIMEGIRTFSRISGLQLNQSKCSIFFGNVTSNVIDLALQHTGFVEGTLPITYLGLPLISGKLSARKCAPLISKLCARIEIWTCRFLSIAGRLQLIKSVLFAIQGYWAMYLFLPKGVLKKIHCILAKFLWGGNSTSNSHHKVSWMECCTPMHEGGLGIRDLFEWNQAAILHHVWRIIHSPDNSLWLQWWHGFLMRNKGFWTMKMPSSY